MKSDWRERYKPWILRKTKFESVTHWWRENTKPYTLLELILKYRKTFLVLAGILGMGLACGVYQFFLDALENNNDILHSSLTILALGLPTFFILWLFRTWDVQRQIDKTEENTNNSTFFECARMLMEGKDLQKRVALERLAYLRRETGFNNKSIDILIQGTGAKKLSYADLRGLDLSGYNLSSSSLDNADLRDTILVDANLVGADLSGADLSGANLYGADLGSANLKDIKLSSATKYNDKTKIANKEIFDKAGMVPDVSDEQK